MEATVFLRLDEASTATRFSDAADGLNDLVAAAVNLPTAVDGFTGLARRFIPDDMIGLVATDRVSGTTLHQRDMTVQALLRWDFGEQWGTSEIGTIYARGKGGSVAEYSSGGIELRAIDFGVRGGEIRWIWHDAAGVLKEQIGAYLIAPSSGWILLTATRRWVSPTEVVLRYFMGDEMLGEVTSADGSIGGGTTGTTQVGLRWTGADWARGFAGDIDQLRVLDRELAPEEIAMTWRRIATYQPLAYELVKALHPPGFPISDDPASRVQKETRLWGHALGLGATGAEVLREHTLPDRTYGTTLVQWEDITKPIPPRPGDSIERRRERVVARLRESKGVAIDGVKGVLAELIDTGTDSLEFLAFSQTTVDTFETLNDLRWIYDPPAQWTIVSNALRVQASGASPLRFDGGIREWYTARQSIGGNGRGAHVLAKLTPTTLDTSGAASTEVGVYLGNHLTGDFILFALKHHGGSGQWQLVSESFAGWVSEGAVVRGTIGGMMPVWLHLCLRETEGFSFGGENTDYAVAWSTVAEAGPYTTVDLETEGISGYQWAGLYARSSDAAIAAAIDVAIDNVKVRAPYGDRPYHFFVYRDPALAGKLDSEAANAILRDLKHGFTVAAVVTRKAALYDDPNTTYESAPMGGI